MKSRLFVCSTQFQVIAMLCLMHNKSQDFTTKANDVVLESIRPHHDEWATVLRKSGFFRHVYVINKGTNFTPLCIHKRLLLSRILRGKIHITWKQLYRAFSNKYDDYVQEEIKTNNKDHLPFRLIEYDEYFVASLNSFGIELELCFHALNAKTFVYDEGVGSYAGCVWENHVTPEAIYLFNADLISTKFETRAIESLSNLTRTPLLETIRDEFNIKPGSMPDFVFFDQWLGMPCGDDSNVSQGWQQSDFITKKANILKSIGASVGEGQFGIKLHPTSCNPEVLAFYKHEKLEILSDNNGIPFELLLTVTTKKPKCLLTIFSSAVITPLTLGIDSDMKAIILWKLFKNDEAFEYYTRNNAISDFFEKVRRKYPNNVYIPESQEELIDILSSKSLTEHSVAKHPVN